MLPTKELKKNYECIVIGGGMSGCSIAFELTKRGMTDILLIERGFLASGATGRCGAGIRQQWGSELNATLAYESTEILEHLEEYTGYNRCCGLNQAGYLLIACNDKKMMGKYKNGVVINILAIIVIGVFLFIAARNMSAFITSAKALFSA